MSERAAGGYSPAWRGLTEVVLPPLIRAVMKRDWHGYEHVPREGGMILAPNHLSYADWGAVALFTHEAGRYPAFLIKSGVFDVKLVGPFMRTVGQLPVRRGEVDAALVLKDAERSLRNGECVVIYPEGTATRDPAKWPMVARTGVARLALTTGAPVIPLAHWGAQDILPYGSKSPHLFPRRTVRMLAGPAVDLSAYADKAIGRQVLRDATETIMAAITGLLAQLRGETPPEVRYDPVAARREARRRAAAQDTAASGGDPARGGPADGDPAASGGDPAGRDPGSEPRGVLPT